MSVYLIVLNEPSKPTWEKVKENWPGSEQHLILTDRIAFIAPPPIALTQEIANTLGISSEGKVIGLVIEANNKAGYNNSSLIEWLGKVEKRNE